MALPSLAEQRAARLARMREVAERARAAAAAAERARIEAARKTSPPTSGGGGGGGGSSYPAYAGQGGGIVIVEGTKGGTTGTPAIPRPIAPIPTGIPSSPGTTATPETLTGTGTPSKGIFTPITGEQKTKPPEPTVDTLSKVAELHIQRRLQTEAQTIYQQNILTPELRTPFGVIIPQRYDQKAIEQQALNIYQQEYARQGLRFVKEGSGYQVVPIGMRTYAEWSKDIEQKPPLEQFVTKATMGYVYGVFNPDYYIDVVTKGPVKAAENVKRLAYSSVEPLRSKKTEYLSFLSSPGYINIVYPALAGFGFGKVVSIVGKAGSGLTGSAAKAYTTGEKVMRTTLYAAGGTYSAGEGYRIGSAFAESYEQGLKESARYATQFGSMLFGGYAATSKPKVKVKSWEKTDIGMSTKPKQTLELGKVDKSYNYAGFVRKQQPFIKETIKSDSYRGYNLKAAASGKKIISVRASDIEPRLTPEAVKIQRQWRLTKSITQGYTESKAMTELKYLTIENYSSAKWNMKQSGLQKFISDTNAQITLERPVFQKHVSPGIGNKLFRLSYTSRISPSFSPFIIPVSFRIQEFDVGTQFIPDIKTGYIPYRDTLRVSDVKSVSDVRSDIVDRQKYEVISGFDMGSSYVDLSKLEQRSMMKQQQRYMQQQISQSRYDEWYRFDRAKVYEPKINKIVSPKPSFPVLPSDDETMLKKTKKMLKQYDKGYRYREWKTPRIKQLLGA